MYTQTQFKTHIASLWVLASTMAISILFASTAYADSRTFSVTGGEITRTRGGGSTQISTPTQTPSTPSTSSDAPLDQGTPPDFEDIFASGDLPVPGVNVPAEDGSDMFSVGDLPEPGQTVPAEDGSDGMTTGVGGEGLRAAAQVVRVMIEGLSDALVSFLEARHGVTVR